MNLFNRLFCKNKHRRRRKRITHKSKLKLDGDEHRIGEIDVEKFKRTRTVPTVEANPTESFICINRSESINDSNAVNARGTTRYTPIKDKNKKDVKHTFVDLDDSSFGDTTDGEERDRSDRANPKVRNSLDFHAFPRENPSRSPAISSGQQFFQDSQLTLSQQRLYLHQQQMNKNMNLPNGPEQKFLQLQRLSNGKLVTGKSADKHAIRTESPTSTDFCLSTDMDDEEYNRVRGQCENLTDIGAGNSLGMGVPPNLITTTSDSTEEGTLFPGISKDKSKDTISTLERMKIDPMENETDDDLRAWLPSNSDETPKKESPKQEKNANSNNLFTFANSFPSNNLSSGSTNDFDTLRSPNDFNKSKSGFSSDQKRIQSNAKTDAVEHPKQRSTPSRDLYPDSTDSEFEPINSASKSQQRRLNKALFDDLSSASSHANAPTTSSPKMGKNARPLSVKSKDLEKTSMQSNIRAELPRSPTSTTKGSSKMYLESPEYDKASDNFSSHSSSYQSKSSDIQQNKMKAKEKLKKRNSHRREKNAVNASVTEFNSVPVSPLPMSSPGQEYNHQQRRDDDSSSTVSDDPDNNWLLQELKGTLGPAGVAADMESLSGRSARSKTSSVGHRSVRSTRSHRSTTSKSRTTSSNRKKKKTRRQSGSYRSSDSLGSRNSHLSARSALSQMSEASQSVAKDLLRLEMQLAMVESEKNKEAKERKRSKSGTGSSVGSYGSRDFSYAATSVISGLSNGGTSVEGIRTKQKKNTSASTRKNKIAVLAPPGKLGIILANKSDNRGTIVSGVRKSSVLGEKISPGDRIVMIDGEDVSQMTVNEITTIMARKNEFERTLTILTTPASRTGKSSGTSTGNSGRLAFDSTDAASSYAGSLSNAS